GLHHGIPLGDDQFAGRRLLFQRWEDRLGVKLFWRQYGSQIRRNDTAFNHVVIADRMAIALEPDELPFVGIEELHPQLGGVWVWCIGADRLEVDPTKDARGWNHNFDRRIAC